MTALYIHWPFCKKKCPYCDFNSHVRASVDMDAWRKALITQMNMMAARMPDTTITSVFFGGGTPSLMPPDITEALLTRMHALWSIADACEITLEANPTSSEAANFRAYRDAGVNRLSLGIQSLHDSELQFLGREHSAAEARTVLEMTATLFDRYSFDLIYARPHQTVHSWTDELQRALPYARGHLSLYQLTVEPDTPFARIYAKGGFMLPDDTIAAALYETTAQLCADHHMAAYEISNYATPGQESRHNLSYWQGDSYIGIGPGAHGRMRDADGIWHATRNIASPERWLHAMNQGTPALDEDIALSHDSRAQELLLSGLRITQGVAYDAIATIINPDKYSQLTQMGLIASTDTHIHVTETGRLLTERIASELLA